MPLLSPRCLFSALFALALSAATLAGAPLATDLRATARHGQVFLTWQEADTPGGTLNVYVANAPIQDVKNARQVGHHIERQSAMDWWRDPASFSPKGKSERTHGYLLQAGAPPLDPRGGLFVYTVRDPSAGQLYFAVTHTDATEKEDPAIIPGVNSLASGIAAQAGKIQPIWQRSEPAPSRGAGKGKGLLLSLHGKSGVIADSEYLAFGDATMGWREGLPFRFSVRVEGDLVVIRPTDRTWINRPHREANDGGASAIWTFWYGYNSNIYDHARMGEGTPTNYTERRLLWILEWVAQYYQTDPMRAYCSGSSMGGCGTISFGLRHPEIFAACKAEVPIVNYTYVGQPHSAARLESANWTGPLTPNLKTDEGVPLLDRMNSTKFIREHHTDLPFLFINNGRSDGSIPWENNPEFYRALGAAAHGFAAYWDDGEHSTAGRNAPKDVLAWKQRYLRFRLDESFPAFANTSSDRNPGNGDRKDGDTIGWMNRGMDWKEIEDAPDHYAIVILADFPEIQYPVRTDVTLRRVQRFKASPGAKLSITIGDAAPRAAVAGPNGMVSIPGVVVPGAEGIKIVVRKGG